MTTQAPSGTVTFMLTDLEGSTRMWEQEPDSDEVGDGPPRRNSREDRSHRNDGFVFSRMGDGMAAAFSRRATR